jgi:ferric-dicitrate binding protein FerR (iron transport regulator)
MIRINRKMKNSDKYTERDWEELAARYSGERSETERISDVDSLETEKKWREISMTNFKDEINIDNAWNKLYGRLKDAGLLTRTVSIGVRSRVGLMLRMAATVAIVAAVGAGAVYIGNSGLFSGSKTVIAGNDQRNVQVSLDDGSQVWLNRNSQLTYYPGITRKSRNVKLTGEAYFEIRHDVAKPFSIDAGKAMIRDLGTSFNVITRNKQNEVEVYVTSGKVGISDNNGPNEIEIDPGYIGKTGSSGLRKELNNDQNYLSWNTDLLVYKNEFLSKVFTDLKKVHNINVIADDPSILDLTIYTTFIKSPQDTIIKSICSSFNLSYRKEGQYYHLSRK